MNRTIPIAPTRPARNYDQTGDHAVALEQRRVFDADSVIQENKIENPVLIDFAMQHNQISSQVFRLPL